MRAFAFYVRQLRDWKFSLDSFDQAIARFAAAYADRNEKDHQALIDAVATGRRITPEPGL